MNWRGSHTNATNGKRVNDQYKNIKEASNHIEDETDWVKTCHKSTIFLQSKGKKDSSKVVDIGDYIIVNECWILTPPSPNFVV